MPQLFQVLRCYKCLVFQVHQVKKSNKWQCKMCGGKQSIKRHYGVGNGKECRGHVQKLNGIRGDIDKASDGTNTVDEEDESSVIEVANNRPVSNKSKWSSYVQKSEEITTENADTTMYLNDEEVVLENPKKRARTKKLYGSYKRKTSRSKNQTDNLTDEDEPSSATINGDIGHDETSFPLKTKATFQVPVLKHVSPQNLICNVNDVREDNISKCHDFTNHEISNVVKSLKVEENRLSNTNVNLVQNSKWSEYIDDEILDNERKESEEDINYSDNEKTSNVSKHDADSLNDGNLHNLFSLYDEKDLDDVLSF